MKAVIKKHPDLDFFFGLLRIDQVPTKQDKYKSIGEYKIVREGVDGQEEVHEVFIKAENKKSIQTFEEMLREELKNNKTPNLPFKKEEIVEVIIAITMTQRRFKEVDVDNLAKSVLDIMKGEVFVDDSQVANLLIKKTVHPKQPWNSIMIGVRKIKENKSWFDHIKLAYFDKVNESIHNKKK